eukprot:TRINITY_DN3636_c0_g1_i2.p1 TRINITY_DN3636_c0_g1~~TRINITY_DN3636_c0_g1_i2.p1  ORF type:complete len:2096 (+),score=647.50 TRINITY_DN3636_c0_g1_i2:904-6288(+)
MELGRKRAELEEQVQQTQGSKKQTKNRALEEEINVTKQQQVLLLCKHLMCARGGDSRDTQTAHQLLGELVGPGMPPIEILAVCAEKDVQAAQFQEGLRNVESTDIKGVKRSLQSAQDKLRMNKTRGKSPAALMVAQQGVDDLELVVASHNKMVKLQEQHTKMLSEYRGKAQGQVQREVEAVMSQLRHMRDEGREFLMRDLAQTLKLKIAPTAEMMFLQRHEPRCGAMRAYVDAEEELGRQMCRTEGNAAARAAHAKGVATLCTQLKGARPDVDVTVWMEQSEGLRSSALKNATEAVNEACKRELRQYKDPGVQGVHSLLAELEQAAAYDPDFHKLHETLHGSVRAAVENALKGCRSQSHEAPVLLATLENVHDVIPDSLLDRAVLEQLRQECKEREAAVQRQWEQSSRSLADAVDALSKSRIWRNLSDSICQDVLKTVHDSIPQLKTCSLRSLMQKLLAEVPLLIEFGKILNDAMTGPWPCRTFLYSTSHLKTHRDEAGRLIQTLSQQAYDRVCQYCAERQTQLVGRAGAGMLKCMDECLPVVLEVLCAVDAYKAAPYDLKKSMLLGQLKSGYTDDIEVSYKALGDRMCAVAATLCNNACSAIDRADKQVMCELLGAMGQHRSTIDELAARFHKGPEAGPSYAAVQAHFGKQVLKARDLAQRRVLAHDDAQSQDASTRQRMYKQLHAAVMLLQHGAALSEHVDTAVVPDVAEVHCNAVGKVKAGMNEMKRELVDIIGQRRHTKRGLRELNTMWKSLQDAHTAFVGHEVGDEVAILLGQLERGVQEASEIRINGFDVTNGDDVLQELVALKARGVHAAVLQNSSNWCIERLLANVLLSGSQNLAALIPKLQRYSDVEYASEAQMLIQDHSAFQGAAVAIRNRDTLCHDLNYVLDAMEKDTRNVEFDASVIRDLHASFDKEYWGWVERGLAESGVQEAAVEAARGIADGDGTTVDKVLGITAAVCAYWTLSFVTGDQKRESLLQPHPAQVVSVLRLLGADNGGTMSNHLAEIGTGEGKSVAVAVCAVVLAMLGYNVNCVCYSALLSSRDEKDFEGLFRAFGVPSTAIQYSTFNRACEVLLNGKLQLRDAVEAAIAGKDVGIYATQSSGDRKHIAIIDEVDTFIGEDFYGNSYPVLAKIRGETVQALYQYVWGAAKLAGSAGSAGPTLAAVQRSPEYQACAAQMRGWEVLLEQAVQAMLAAVQDPLTGYVVAERPRGEGMAIGFPAQHGVNFSRCCYRTVFAYYIEHDRDASKITEATRNYYSTLLVQCGVFSYAAIPRQYECILGVTGTLSALTGAERALLQKDYGIAKYSYLPSVYGKNELVFAGDTTDGVVIDTRAGHNLALTNEIKKRHERGQPVIVFFSGRAAMQEYMGSVQFQQTRFKDNVVTLTEAESDGEKFSRVRQSTLRNMVTLAVRSFGRGTDFKCYDITVKECGGVHVVAAFVPDEPSEEIQLMGRAARQGKKGGFSMVLVQEDLERFGLSEADVATMKSTERLWTTINAARNEFAGAQFAERMRNQDAMLQTQHDASLAFSTVLQSGDKAAVCKFLEEQNRVSSGVATKRVLVLMDATGSMASLITKTKHAVSTMFSRVFATLEEAKCPTGCALQFAVYRNYDRKSEELLQHTGFEVAHRELEAFMAKVLAGGGTWRNEAIEIGLWHANRMADADEGLHEVILIGDAPANTPDQVEIGRSKFHGESYWRTTPHAIRTTADEQARQLAAKGIPVHAFYVAFDDAVKTCFEGLAHKTGGQCGPLNVATAEGHERLTQLVSERVLDSIGGADLLQRYRAKFGHIDLA